jgi:hypothetical protein
MSEYENVAPTRLDRVRRKDLESFKALAEIEGREIISEKKLTDELFLRETRVTYESFDFYMAEEDRTYRFNIRYIKDAIAEGKIPFTMFRAELTEKWKDLIIKHAGIEMDRVPLVKNLNRPGLMILWPNDTSLLVDGNHRLIARWNCGLRHFRYAAVAFTDITKYVMWRKGRSEIISYEP